VSTDPKLSRTIIFVSGNFFVLHPGHLRLLKFASECGDYLYVGVNDTRPSSDYPSAQERAETLRELNFIHDVTILHDGLENFLHELKPDVIVKGKEYEATRNPEEAWLKNWGGKLLFAAGDAIYSGTSLLRDSHSEQGNIWRKPKEYIERHSCYRENLMPIIDNFRKINVAVVGDLILDEYIQCEALGMSREDPTLVVSPQETKRFLGGAAIVAAHCKSMGASAQFHSVLGNDDLSIWAEEKLAQYGVKSKIKIDESRPTTLKQRYRVGQKTMIRVSHLRQHEISSDIQNQIYSDIESDINNIDCLIFSDFNYGVLPEKLVKRLIKLGRKHKVFLAADSQASSQIGDITRFSGVDLVTPTEYEARISLREPVSGLNIIAQDLINKCMANLAIITLGEAGSLVVDRSLEIDRLPSLNVSPVDISGAGDSMLVGVALAKTLKIDSFKAAYIGAIASAIQVGRLGNTPISALEMQRALA